MKNKNEQRYETKKIKVRMEGDTKNDSTLLSYSDIENTILDLAAKIDQEVWSEWFANESANEDPDDLPELLIVAVANGGYPFSQMLNGQLEKLQDASQGNVRRRYHIGRMTVKVATRDERGRMLDEPTIETFPSEVKEVAYRFHSGRMRILKVDDIHETGTTLNKYVDPLLMNIFLNGQDLEKWRKVSKSAAVIWKPSHSPLATSCDWNQNMKRIAARSGSSNFPNSLDFYGWRVTDHWLRGFGMNGGTPYGRGLMRITIDQSAKVKQDFAMPIAVRWDYTNKDASRELNEIIRSKNSANPGRRQLPEIDLEEALLQVRPPVKSSSG